MNLNDAIGIYIGNEVIEAVYIGTTLIWSAAPQEVFDQTLVYDNTNIATEFTG